MRRWYASAASPDLGIFLTRGLGGKLSGAKRRLLLESMTTSANRALDRLESTASTQQQADSVVSLQSRKQSAPRKSAH